LTVDVAIRRQAVARETAPVVGHEMLVVAPSPTEAVNGE
jgi:hypothetical protein